MVIAKFIGLFFFSISSMLLATRWIRYTVIIFFLFFIKEEKEGLILMAIGESFDFVFKNLLFAFCFVDYDFLDKDFSSHLI